MSIGLATRNRVAIGTSGGSTDAPIIAAFGSDLTTWKPLYINRYLAGPVHNGNDVYISDTGYLTKIYGILLTDTIQSNLNTKVSFSSPIYSASTTTIDGIFTANNVSNFYGTANVFGDGLGWISETIGPTTNNNRVVIGSQLTHAIIGAHVAALSGWAPLDINRISDGADGHDVNITCSTKNCNIYGNTNIIRSGTTSMTPLTIYEAGLIDQSEVSTIIGKDSSNYAILSYGLNYTPGSGFPYLRLDIKSGATTYNIFNGVVNPIAGYESFLSNHIRGSLDSCILLDTSSTTAGTIGYDSTAPGKLFYRQNNGLRIVIWSAVGTDKSAQWAIDNIENTNKEISMLKNNVLSLTKSLNEMNTKMLNLSEMMLNMIKK